MPRKLMEFVHVKFLFSLIEKKKFFHSPLFWYWQKRYMATRNSDSGNTKLSSFLFFENKDANIYFGLQYPAKEKIWRMFLFIFKAKTTRQSTHFSNYKMTMQTICSDRLKNNFTIVLNKNSARSNCMALSCLAYLSSIFWRFHFLLFFMHLFYRVF